MELDPKNLAYASLSAVAVAYSLAKVREYVMHSSAAKAKGCKPAVISVSSEVTGLRIIRRMLSALHAKAFPIWAENEFAKTSELHGRQVDTMVLQVPLFDTAILTRDPRNVQAMLATSFKDYGMGEHRSANFAALLGNSIFGSDGKHWEHSRALVRPQFARTQISDLDMVERHVIDLMQVLDRTVQTDGWTSVTDLRPLFFNLTMDSASEFLFGESVHCQVPLEHGNEEIASQALGITEAFDAAQLTISGAQTLGPYYWWMHDAALRKNAAKVHAFTDNFVKKALALGKDEKQEEKQDFESPKKKYVFLNELAQVTQDPIELRSQLLSVLFAGRDTTASALGWLWYVLAKPENKPIFERLRREVIDTFGTYDVTEKISFESLKGCRYLQWCINEVQRVYPIVTYNNRMALKDTTLPFGGGPDGESPIYVKKGQAIEFSIYSMHRRKDIWGGDADEFRPERWAKHRPGWEYLPFSGGPRVCIGQQFALTEMGYVMVRMLQRVDEVDGSELGPPQHDLTLIDTPLSVKLRMHFVQ